MASTAMVTPRPSLWAAPAGDGIGRSYAATTSGGGVGRGLLELDRLAALVPAAVRADVVRQLHLVAVIALHELRHAQRQVRAALALAGMRDASLGNSHGPWSPSMSVRGVGRAVWPQDATGCPAGLAGPMAECTGTAVPTRVRRPGECRPGHEEQMSRHP